MASDLPSDSASLERTIRADLLEMASEDCYGFIEFHAMWDRLLPNVSEPEVRQRVRGIVERLVREGSVLVHRGNQCTGNDHSGQKESLTSDQFSKVSIHEWMSGQLYLCRTERTDEEFNRVYEHTSFHLAEAQPKADRQ